MTTHTAYFIHPEGHPVLMGTIEQQVQFLLNYRGINGTASWYYDEFVDGPEEYGVKIVIHDVTRAQFQLQLISIRSALLDSGHDDIRIEFP